MSGSSEVLLGVGVADGPAYLGSDERKTRAVPLVAARWRNGWFAGTGGIGYRFGGDEPISWGMRLGVDRGRDEDDADALRGMGDIKARPEYGVFASYAFMPNLRLGASLRAGSGNQRNGVLVDVSLGGGYPISSSTRLTFGVTATAANSNSMQSEFGVDSVQAQRSGYSTYSPRGGLRDISLQAGSMVMLQPNVTLFLGINGRSLLGDGSDSPLTRERRSVGAMASLAFRL